MDANNYNRNFMLWGGNFARAQAPQPGYTVENGVLTSATYAGVAGRDYAVYDMISREATAKSNYITFDADWQINDSLSSKFQVGTTEGEGSTERQFIAEVTTNRGGGASWTSHGTSSPLDWSVGGDSTPTGVTSFGTWGNQQVTATDTEDWINLDFSKDLDAGALTSLDFGARFADHERETQSPEGASPGDIWSDLQNGQTALYPSDFASDIDGTFPRELWFFTPNAMKEAILANSTWLSDNDGPTGRHNYGGEWKVAETNLAAYVQANFAGEAWSGNFGLRYVDIDQEINSYQAVASAANADVSSLFGNWIYQDTNNKHSKVLPSANLKFNMGEDVVLRFAASQTMTLPDYSALGASSWGSDLNRTGGGGNPNLQPVLSTNFDGNLEWYFMPRGLVSVGAFSMDLKDYVAFGTETRMLYSELTNQLEAYLVSVPVNSNGSGDGPGAGLRAAHRRIVRLQRQLHLRGWQDRSHLGRRQQQSGGHLEGHLQRGRVFREREVQRTCELHLSHVVPDRPVGHQPVLPGRFRHSVAGAQLQAHRVAQCQSGRVEPQRPDTDLLPERNGPHRVL